jgi:CMP-N,N'-diacetyllegionaminic acid synthase
MITSPSMKVLAVIPARSGSKGVPHKNILPFCGKPLIAHSIEQAKQCPRVNRVIVSTDSAEYATVARESGAEAPFLRPAEISGDSSTDLELFEHALRWLKDNENYSPDICVHLRPTHPNRKVDWITEAVDLLIAHPEWDSVRSIAPAPETPFKMWFLKPDQTLDSVVKTDIPEAHSQPRQILPRAYLQNANIDVVRTRTILEMRSMVGRAVGGYVMSACHDIDTIAQFRVAEAEFRRGNGKVSGRTYCIDIDGVIATITPENNYNLAQPLRENISKINALYDAGNKIVLFTARGTLTGLDWREVTEKQMRDWGVKHHNLRFGKPAADFYIDDRMLSLQDF